MLVSYQHPEVAALKGGWQPFARNQTEGSIQKPEFECRLAETIVIAAQPFVGQLILYFHSYVRRFNTGHSFARGFETGSDTVYHVWVARLADHVGLHLEQNCYPVGKAVGLKALQQSSQLRYTVPVRWVRPLYPIYRNVGPCPSYILSPPQPRKYHLPWTEHLDSDVLPFETDRRDLDISGYGRHIFRVGPEGDLDWSHQYEVALGTETVAEWLAKRGSLSAFVQLAIR